MNTAILGFSSLKCCLRGASIQKLWQRYAPSPEKAPSWGVATLTLPELPNSTPVARSAASLTSKRGRSSSPSSIRVSRLLSQHRHYAPSPRTAPMPRSEKPVSSNWFESRVNKLPYCIRYPLAPFIGAILLAITSDSNNIVRDGVSVKDNNVLADKPAKRRKTKFL